MVRKLTIDSISSDLTAVSALLSRRNADTDPIGFLQFSIKAEELEPRLFELGEMPETTASLAVFFGGLPVQGSRGVSADFAGKAVALIQDLVAKQFANMERGAMSVVGPVPLRGNSDLLLTEIARGSVGVILEEADVNQSLTESELSVAVHKVAEDIQETSKVDSTDFEELLGEVDPRYFSALTDFFKLFDDARATVRLVETDQDFELDLQAIHRGRERTEAAITNDLDDVPYTGRLYLLPTQRKFELSVVGSGETIHGNVSREFASANLAQLRAKNVVNHDWIVKLKVRTINRPNRPSQIKYTLMGLIEEVVHNSGS